MQPQLGAIGCLVGQLGYDQMIKDLVVDLADPGCRMHVVYVLQSQHDHDFSAQ